MSSVSTQVSNPTAADTSPKQIELTNREPGGIKILQPGMKDPNDQLISLLDQIEALKAPAAQGNNYVGAFSPETDQNFVEMETGNALVKASESLANMFSTAPEIREEGPDIMQIILWAGIGYLVFKIYKRGK